MPESNDLFNEVAQIKDEVEDVREMVDALVRINSNELKTGIVKEMAADRALAEVFLLIDGKRSQGAILRSLQEKGSKGASPASVSRKLDRLVELNLIHFIRREAAGKVYRTTRLAHVLGLHRALGKAT